MPRPSGPEALGSASGCAVPTRHRLLWPHPRLGSSPAVLGLGFRRRVFAHGPSPEGPQFKLCVSRSVPLPLPRRPGGLGLFNVRPRWPSPNAKGLGVREVPARSRFTAGLPFGACGDSLIATARIVACPSPTRAFTFELSSHESPRWYVEHDYAAKQSIAAAGLAPARHTAVWAALASVSSL